MRMLLVEDDPKLAAHLRENLGDQGFLVTSVATYEDLQSLLSTSSRFDLVVMDRLLGAFDAKKSLPAMKEKWPAALVVVVSAISTPNERTDLLNLGADDYLGKPFSTQELIARIRALLRRTAVPAENYLQIGNLIIDSMKRVVSVGDRSETFPSREFALLRTLALEPSKIWSRDELLDYIWGQTSDIESNVVEATIANIRKKIGDLGANISIRNLRNAGYWIAQ